MDKIQEERLATRREGTFKLTIESSSRAATVGASMVPLCFWIIAVRRTNCRAGSPIQMSVSMVVAGTPWMMAADIPAI